MPVSGRNPGETPKRSAISAPDRGACQISPDTNPKACLASGKAMALNFPIKRCSRNLHPFYNFLFGEIFAEQFRQQLLLDIFQRLDVF
jgi:hypothetical protein